MPVFLTVFNDTCTPPLLLVSTLILQSSFADCWLHVEFYKRLMMGIPRDCAQDEKRGSRGKEGRKGGGER